MSDHSSTTSCVLAFAVVLVVGMSTCAPSGNKSVSGELRYSQEPAKAAEPKPTSVPTQADVPQARADTLPISGIWVPSGWMGDGEAGPGALRHEVWTADFASAPSCERWEYRPREGRVGWAAVAYQFPANNWGDDAAGKDLRNGAFTHLSFKARGEHGGERVIFSSGGQTKPASKHRASYATGNTEVQLTKEWKEYRISLRNMDLTNTVSALTFAVNREMTPTRCVFFLDDVQFDRETGARPGR